MDMSVKPAGSDTEVFLSRIDEYTEEYMTVNPPDEDTKNAEWFSALIYFLYTRIFRPEADSDAYQMNKYNTSQRSLLNYQDIETMDKIFDAYIMLCGRFKQCPSILGFASLIGVDRCTLTDWRDGRTRGNSYAHGSTVKRWFLTCESALAQRAVMSNSIGSIFALKSNYKWRETAPVVPEKTQSVTSESPLEIQQKYASATSLPEKPDELFDD